MIFLKLILGRLRGTVDVCIIVGVGEACTSQQDGLYYFLSHTCYFIYEADHASIFCTLHRAHTRTRGNPCLWNWSDHWLAVDTHTSTCRCCVKDANLEIESATLLHHSLQTQIGFLNLIGERPPDFEFSLVTRGRDWCSLLLDSDAGDFYTTVTLLSLLLFCSFGKTDFT